MNVNPATIPTFLLAYAFFAAGEYCYQRMPRLSLAIGTLMALPCMLAVIYYAHIFDHAAWYFNFRTIPWIELTFAGIGFLGGSIQRWNDAETSTGRLAVPVLFGLVVLVPFMKPIIHPLKLAALQDKCVGHVCLQSSGSTCGPASAASLLRWFGQSVTEKDLAQQSYSYPGGTEAWYLARAIRHRGAQTAFVFTSDTLPSPSIAGVKMGGGHFIAIESATPESVTYVDPLKGEFTITPAELRARYTFTGFFLQVSPTKR